MRRWVAAGVLVVLAGCGGGSTTATDTSTPTVTSLMAAANCDGNVVGRDPYTVETGLCTMTGGNVTVATFATSHQRDLWLKTGGILGGTAVHGDRWAAVADSPDDARAFATANA